ncbi:MAG: 3'-5' exonuclease [Crocinitomicaceae bacterium]|nr:3'-5' exonuclease [Crocinitomicaceae bacterium]|tara:strand:+ start:263 stop:985 length:723 start_codon:yes stop_codon:yes gene_type:complete
MLEKINLEKVLFLDIETVPQFPDFSDVPEHFQQLWEKKAAFLKKEEEQTAADLYERAGIYAEFGKIVCISVGFVRNTRTGKQLRLKSFYHDDEATLLKQFIRLLDDHYNTPYHVLCGHNAKEFDFPYIARRILINGLKLPNALNIAGKKPWEIAHIDTMELWKFGDFKHYTSLNLLAAVFDIPTPKDDIDGSQVGAVYHQEQNLERIKVYCEKDVVTVVQLFLRYRGEALIDEAEIEVSP